MSGHVADAVAQYLGSAVDGLAYSSADDGNVFVDHMPSTPDRCVAVYTTPGPEADSKLPYDAATFQVVVRCESGGTWADDKWAAIYSALHGLRNETLPGGVLAIFVLSQQSSPFRLGQDDNGRWPLSGNFRSEVYNPTVHRGG